MAGCLCAPVPYPSLSKPPVGWLVVVLCAAATWKDLWRCHRDLRRACAVNESKNFCAILNKKRVCEAAAPASEPLCVLIQHRIGIVAVGVAERKGIYVKCVERFRYVNLR